MSKNISDKRRDDLDHPVNCQCNDCYCHRYMIDQGRADAFKKVSLYEDVPTIATNTANEPQQKPDWQECKPTVSPLTHEVNELGEVVRKERRDRWIHTNHLHDGTSRFTVRDTPQEPKHEWTHFREVGAGLIPIEDVQEFFDWLEAGFAGMFGRPFVSNYDDAKELILLKIEGFRAKHGGME